MEPFPLPLRYESNQGSDPHCHGPTGYQRSRRGEGNGGADYQFERNPLRAPLRPFDSGKLSKDQMARFPQGSLANREVNARFETIERQERGSELGNFKRSQESYVAKSETDEKHKGNQENASDSIRRGAYKGSQKAQIDSENSIYPMSFRGLTGQRDDLGLGRKFQTRDRNAMSQEENRLGVWRQDQELQSAERPEEDFKRGTVKPEKIIGGLKERSNGLRFPVSLVHEQNGTIPSEKRTLYETPDYSRRKQEESSNVLGDGSRGIRQLGQSSQMRSATPVVNKLESKLQFEPRKQENPNPNSSQPVGIAHNEKFIRPSMMGHLESNVAHHERNNLNENRVAPVVLSSLNRCRSASSSTKLDQGARRLQFYSDEMKDFSLDPKPISNAILRRNNPLFLSASKSSSSKNEGQSVQINENVQNEPSIQGVPNVEGDPFGKRKPQEGLKSPNQQGFPLEVQREQRQLESQDEKMARIRRDFEKRKETAHKETMSQREPEKTGETQVTLQKEEFLSMGSRMMKRDYSGTNIGKFQQTSSERRQNEPSLNPKAGSHNLNGTLSLNERKVDSQTQVLSGFLGNQQFEKEPSRNLAYAQKYSKRETLPREKESLEQNGRLFKRNLESKSLQVEQIHHDLERNGEREEKSVDLSERVEGFKRRRDPETMSQASSESRADLRERIKQLKEKIEQNKLERNEDKGKFEKESNRGEDEFNESESSWPKGGKERKEKQRENGRSDENKRRERGTEVKRGKGELNERNEENSMEFGKNGEKRKLKGVDETDFRDLNESWEANEKKKEKESKKDKKSFSVKMVQTDEESHKELQENFKQLQIEFLQMKTELEKAKRTQAQREMELCFANQKIQGLQRELDQQVIRKPENAESYFGLD